MYVGLKQPRGDGERYVTPARAAAKETKVSKARTENNLFPKQKSEKLRKNLMFSRPQFADLVSNMIIFSFREPK